MGRTVGVAVAYIWILVVPQVPLAGRMAAILTCRDFCQRVCRYSFVRKDSQQNSTKTIGPEWKLGREFPTNYCHPGPDLDPGSIIKIIQEKGLLPYFRL